MLQRLTVDCILFLTLCVFMEYSCQMIKKTMTSYPVVISFTHTQNYEVHTYLYMSTYTRVWYLSNRSVYFNGRDVRLNCGPLFEKPCRTNEELNDDIKLNTEHSHTYQLTIAESIHSHTSTYHWGINYFSIFHSFYYCPPISRQTGPSEAENQIEDGCPKVLSKPIFMCQYITFNM